MIKNRSRMWYQMANIEVAQVEGDNNWALLIDPDGYIAEGTGDNFFMIKNECLAYSRVNLERRKIIVKLRKAIKDNDSYMEIYRNGNCTNSKQISQKIRIFDSNLVRNLRHINDYMDKLRNSQYDEFTTSRLQLVLSEFDSLNQFMSKQICRYVD